MRWLFALLLAVPLRAQVMASASLTRGMVSARPDLIDRETFGLRYRTPPLARFTLQAGVLQTTENGILHPSEGAGIRHWAVGGEYLVTKWWRAQLIYGNFDELRPHDSALPFTYYRFGAIGNVFQLGQTSVTVEKLISAMHETHAGIHDIVVQAHGGWFDVMIGALHGSPDQPIAYHFVTAEATVRPCFKCAVPFRYLGIEGGTRALPSPTADREVSVSFVAIGLFFSLVPRI